MPIWSRMLVLPALALAGLAAAPQNPPSQEADTSQMPVFQVRSDLVLIDLIATLDGKYVPDLRADEIEVFEDGKRQNIRFFEAVDLDQTDRPASEIPAPLPEAAQFVVLIDLGQLSVESRRFVIPAIEDVVGKRLKERDRVMLATMGRSGVQIRVPLTENLAEVVSVARTVLEEQDSWGRNEGPDLGGGLLENVPVIDEGGLGAGPGAAALASSEYLSRQEAALRQVADVGHSLELLSRHLQELPGRKNVVFISDGYRLHIEGSNADLRSSVNFHDALRPAITAANRAQTAFYTIDPRGVGADDSLRALHTTLARDTGGVAIFGSNRLEDGIEQAYIESKRYYRLAFAPNRKSKPGKTHRITIKVKRPGVELRYRTEYVEVDPEEASQSDVLNALAFPELFHEFDFQLKTRIRENHLLLETRIPADQVKVRKEGALVWTELAFYAQLTDDSGAPVQKKLPLARRYPLRWTLPQYKALDVLTADHPLDFALDSGTYRLTVAISQVGAQRVSARRMTIIIP